MLGLEFRTLVVVTLCFVASVGLAGAQSARTSGQELQISAAQLVADYAARRPQEGNADLVRGLFWRGCPREDARRDSIFTGLLKLEATSRIVMEIAMSWQGALGRCNDSRFDEYFRMQADRATEPLILEHLINGLLVVRPIPENVAAAKEIAFDSTRSDKVRSLVLLKLVQQSPRAPQARERVELLAEVYRRSGRIPEPYHQHEVWFIKRTSDVGYWRSRLTDALLAGPEMPGALALLQTLGTDALFEEGGKDQAWVRTFRSALTRLEANPGASVALKSGAAKTRTMLDRRPD